MSIDTEVRRSVIDDFATVLNTKKVAKHIEHGIHEFSKEFCVNNQCNDTLLTNIYNDKCNELKQNLTKESTSYNKCLHEQLLHGGFDAPYSVAFMSPHQLNPDAWSEIFKHKEIKDKYQKNVITTELYKCKTCNKRKCTTMQSQTRGTDESITTFVTCMNCGNRWRVD